MPQRMKEETADLWNQMVNIKLFKDNGKYKDPVFCAVNGRRFLIERGVEVSVPYPIYETLIISMEQDASTMALIEKMESEYRA